MTTRFVSWFTYVTLRARATPGCDLLVRRMYRPCSLRYGDSSVSTSYKKLLIKTSIFRLYVVTNLSGGND